MTLHELFIQLQTHVFFPAPLAFPLIDRCCFSADPLFGVRVCRHHLTCLIFFLFTTRFRIQSTIEKDFAGVQIPHRADPPSPQQNGGTPNPGHFQGRYSLGKNARFMHYNSILNWATCLSLVIRPIVIGNWSYSHW